MKRKEFWIHKYIVSNYTYSEGIKQVEKTPGNDNVIVESDEEGNDCTCESDASDRRVDHVPCSHWALA